MVQNSSIFPSTEDCKKCFGPMNQNQCISCKNDEAVESKPIENSRKSLKASQCKKDDSVSKSAPRASLSFKELVDVVLIPSRKELKSVSSELWWSREDFNANQDATLR